MPETAMAGPSPSQTSGGEKPASEAGGGMVTQQEVLDVKVSSELL